MEGLSRLALSCGRFIRAIHQRLCGRRVFFFFSGDGCSDVDLREREECKQSVNSLAYPADTSGRLTGLLFPFV